jgi:hypothetical protein
MLAVVALAAAANAKPGTVPLSFDTVWTHDLGTPTRGNPGLVETERGPLVIIGTDGGDVVALDGRGEVRWRKAIGGQVYGWPTTIELPAGRTILIGNSMGMLYAFAPDGKVRWSISLGDLRKADWGHSGISPWCGPALLRGGGAKIVVTDRSGRISALTGDGRIVWQTHLTERTHFNVIGAPAVGDLDGDGEDEIVVGSFDGRILCFGADGAFRWGTDALWAEAGYHAPLIVDHGEGPRVLVVGRNQGEIRCLDGTGREIWRRESPNTIGQHMAFTPYTVGGERRLFVGYNKTGQDILDARGNVMRTISIGGGGSLVFGPTAADLDGDGRVELLMPRTNHPTIHVLNGDGNERGRIEFGGATWGAPLIADLDGDRIPEFVLVNANTGQLRAFRARGARPGGEIQWPTSRGPYDGRRSILPESRAARQAPPAAGGAPITSEGPSLSGTGRRTLKYGAPGAPAGSWISTAVSVPGGMRHIFANRLDDPDHGWVEMLDAGTYVVTVRLHSAAGAILGEKVERIPFVPFEPERAAGRALLAELAAATGAADADREARQEVLDARMERAVKGTTGQRRSLAAQVAREHACLRAEIARRRFAGRQAEIAAWPTAHPWTPYDPAIDVPAADGPREIRVAAERRAHEVASIAVANLSGKTLSVRAWLDPWTGGKNPPAVNTVTLRRRVFVATARSGYTPDALSEIDSSGVVTIPAGETIRLWLDFASGGAPAGTYMSKLHLRALTVAGQVVDMPVAWEILPFQLPDESPLAFHVWAYERPAFFDRESVWKDLIAHRVNVWDLPLAKAVYDAEGRIVSEDWSATEEILGRAPAGSWFFWSASDAIVKPAEGAPPVGSPAWDRAFRAWVPRWMDGLAARGLPRDRHMNYILDEPGIRGGPDVEEFIRVAKLYKGVDPRVQIFANAAAGGGATNDHLDRLNKVVDIFDPVYSDPRTSAPMRRVLGYGKRTWSYECGDGAKDQVRMKYYWEPLWNGAEIGLTGFGIWSYAGRGVDFWKGPGDDVGCCDWELVYPGSNGSVIPSHRWQGVRIGVEDYARLAMLGDAAERARQRGDASRAAHLADRRAALIRDVVASGCDEAVAARARAEIRFLLREEALLAEPTRR